MDVRLRGMRSGHLNITKDSKGNDILILNHEFKDHIKNVTGYNLSDRNRDIPCHLNIDRYTIKVEIPGKKGLKSRIHHGTINLGKLMKLKGKIELPYTLHTSDNNLVIIAKLTESRRKEVKLKTLEDYSKSLIKADVINELQREIDEKNEKKKQKFIDARIEAVTRIPIYGRDEDGNVKRDPKHFTVYKNSGDEEVTLTWHDYSNSSTFSLDFDRFSDLVHYLKKCEHQTDVDAWHIDTPDISISIRLASSGALNPIVHEKEKGYGIKVFLKEEKKKAFIDLHLGAYSQIGLDD